MAYSVPDVTRFGMEAAEGAPKIVGADMVTGAGPKFAIDPIIGGSLIQAGGGLLGALGGAFRKKKTTPGMHAQMRAALPQSARVPFSPEQREMFDMQAMNLLGRLRDSTMGQDRISQFAQGLNLTGSALSDLSGRAAELAERYASKSGA